MAEDRKTATRDVMMAGIGFVAGGLLVPLLAAWGDSLRDAVLSPQPDIGLALVRESADASMVELIVRNRTRDPLLLHSLTLCPPNEFYTSLKVGDMDPWPESEAEADVVLDPKIKKHRFWLHWAERHPDFRGGCSTDLDRVLRLAGDTRTVGPRTDEVVAFEAAPDVRLGGIEDWGREANELQSLCLLRLWTSTQRTDKDHMEYLIVHCDLRSGSEP